MSNCANTPPARRYFDAQARPDMLTIGAGAGAVRSAAARLAGLLAALRLDSVGRLLAWRRPRELEPAFVDTQAIWKAVVLPLLASLPGSPPAEPVQRAVHARIGRTGGASAW